MARMTPAALRPYHVVPPLAVAALPALGLVSLSRKGRCLVVGLAGLYAAACAVASVSAGRGEPRGVRAVMPMVFPVLHGSWGLGFLSGLFGPRLEQMPDLRDSSP